MTYMDALDRSRGTDRDHEDTYTIEEIVSRRVV